jgi:hypothetical protein
MEFQPVTNGVDPVITSGQNNARLGVGLIAVRIIVP